MIYAITIYPNQMGRKPFEEYGPELRWFHVQASGLIAVLGDDLQPIKPYEYFFGKEVGIIEDQPPPGWTNPVPHYLLDDTQAKPADILASSLSHWAPDGLTGHAAIGIEKYAIDQLNKFADEYLYWVYREHIYLYSSGRPWAATLRRWEVTFKRQHPTPSVRLHYTEEQRP